MSEPLISVIMPTYNQAEFIREAIASVLNQTHKNLELIVVDNYSTDDTQQAVASFHDGRLRYYKFSNNGIIAASRNYGLRESKGKYAAFIDSDDAWFKDKLREQIDIMENDAGCQMTFCQFQASDVNGQPHGKIFGPKDFKISGHIYDKLIQCNFIVSSSVVLRNAVLKSVGYFDETESLRCAEDFDLWLRVARRDRVAFVPKVLGMYRMHSSANVSSQRLQKALNVIDKHLSAGWTTFKQANRAKANFYFREGWSFLNSNIKLARSYFWRACGLNSNNLKIIFLSLAGLGISFFPFIYHRLQANELDKKIARSFNPQNL